MSEEATPTPAPASDGAATGSGEPTPAAPVDGSVATPASGSAPAPSGSTGVDWQARAREEQSRADKLAAQLASVNSAPAPTPAPAEPVNVGAEVARVLTLRDTRDALAKEHPELAVAKPAIFEGYLDYDSPEAFRAKVQTEVQAVSELTAAITASKDAEIRALYEAKYGPIESPVNEGENPEAELTLAKYQAMSFADRLKLQREHPELVEALTSASTS